MELTIGLIGLIIAAVVLTEFVLYKSYNSKTSEENGGDMAPKEDQWVVNEVIQTSSRRFNNVPECPFHPGDGCDPDADQPRICQYKKKGIIREKWIMATIKCKKGE